MTDFRLAFGSDHGLRFERPEAVLRATTPAQAYEALDQADRALRDGFWIAGVLDYELSAVALGVFGPPVGGGLAAPQPPRISPLRPLVDRARYDAAIAQIAQTIYDGGVYQVNLTIPFAFSFEGDAASLYAALAARSGAPYTAMLEDGSRCVLSFSPELFLEFSGDRIATKPMKGTARLDRIEELDSPKNRAEHVMIVDLLRNDLYRVCERVDVEKLFDVERYPTFATMTSTIAGHLRQGTSLSEIVRATFPCGSITGAPKRAAIAQIARLEQTPRGAYCGSLGFLSPQRRGWWNVAIRTAQLDTARGIGRFDAGGGIVADSRADEEWDEIGVKTRFFAELSRPFDVRETFAGGDADVRAAHLRRLWLAARAFDVPFDSHAVNEAIDRVDQAGVLLRLRLSFDGSLEILTEPLRALDEPARICISDVRVESEDPMLAWKTSWRPAYDRAATYARERACFDALLLNERGRLTEGSRTNLFARIDGELVTPPQSDGLFPGLLRQRLLAAGDASERSLTPDDLARAGEIFIGNSTRGMVRALLTEGT